VSLSLVTVVASGITFFQIMSSNVILFKVCYYAAVSQEAYYVLHSVHLVGSPNSRMKSRREYEVDGRHDLRHA